MQTVRYCEIPSYLRKGDFFRSLASDDPESLIEIPLNKFHQDRHFADNVTEFRDLLGTIDFWMLDDIPPGILDFCDRVDSCTWSEEIFSLPEAVQVNYLTGIVAAYAARDTNDFVNLVKTGRWEFVDHVFGKLNKNSIATAAAAKAGSLRLVKHLHEKGFAWHATTCADASYHGNLPILKYARENGCPWSSAVYDLAAQKDRLECMEYAHEKGLMWGPRVCTIAAQFGSLRCLTFAHQHGCQWGRDTVAAAVRNGNVECLRYLLINNCPHMQRACDMACDHNQLACLALLHELDESFDAGTSNAAARCSDAACLEFLHENGCPWDARTTNTAATYGRLNTLRYAMENGCPYDDDILGCAMKSDSLDCLQYLIEDQLMGFTDTSYITALLGGKLVHLQYLLDHGCPVIDPAGSVHGDSAYDDYFSGENPSFPLCVEFAVERGWIATDYFIRYIIIHDISNCTTLCVDQGWLAYSSTGEGFIKFVRGVCRNDEDPMVRFVFEKGRFYFDNVFSRSWNDPTINSDLLLHRSVRLAMIYGWVPDKPVRYITGISLWYCWLIRILAVLSILGHDCWDIVHIVLEYPWCIGIYLSSMHYYLKVVAFIFLVPEPLGRITAIIITRVIYAVLAMYSNVEVN